MGCDEKGERGQRGVVIVLMQAVILLPGQANHRTCRDKESREPSLQWARLPRDFLDLVAMFHERHVQLEFVSFRNARHPKVDQIQRHNLRTGFHTVFRQVVNSCT